MNVSFTKKSKNSKTGPIPVTSQESSTCPPSCPHQGKGCYPKYSYTGIHWRNLDEGKTGITWDQFITELEKLTEGTIWRYGVAGDLPGAGSRINKAKLGQMVKANKGKDAIAYTHKPMSETNKQMVKDANEQGFTINLSADSIKDADKKMGYGIAPVVLTIPEDPALWPKATTAGHKIIPCPAVTHEGVTCKTCKLCAKGDRKFIVGFPAHGTGKRMVEKVYFDL